MTGTLLGTIGAIGAALITAVFTYLGVRRSAKAQASQAATERELGLIDRWKNFADEAEERADRIEQRVNAKIAAQDAEFADQRTRLEAVERTNHTLQEENRRFRDALTQVMYWLARNLEHEKSGHGPPPPHAVGMILRYVRESLNIQDPK